MYGLLYKDVIIHKKLLLATLGVIVFFSAIMVVAPLTDELKDFQMGLVLTLASIAIMLVVGMFEQGLYEQDERKKWQSLIASTSEGVRHQIASKYIFSAALSITVTTWCLLIYSIAGAISDTDITIYTVLLLQFLWIQLTIRAIETPFLVRFGSKQGNMFRMVLFGVIALVIITYGLFGDMSVFGSMENFLLWLKDALSDNSSIFLRLTPALSMCFFYLSYRLSCVWYLKGGEYYDK